MKLILIFFRPKNLLSISLTDDFHVMNVPTKPTDKASVPIHIASRLPAIAVAHPVDGAMILF